MTTETTDALETVMEAAEKYVLCYDNPNGGIQARERLRLHVQLFRLLTQVDEHEVACQMRGANEQCERYQRLTDDLAALEARLQED